MTEEIFMDARAVGCPMAREVLSILDSGEYQAASGGRVSIREEQAAAEAGTRLYSPEELAALTGGEGAPGRAAPPVEIVAATTQEAAHELAAFGVTLLNFASARNPGGGFIGGAKAQEEDICRCSGLYRALLRQPRYYEINRAQPSALYTDYQIFSPGVPFFRVASKAPLLERPFLASVITAPAPNAGAMLKNQPEEIPLLRETFVRRWKNVLAVAADTGARVLLLGAWGCGAFHNDPVLVAETAKSVIETSPHAAALERIVFSIPSFKSSAPNLKVFREIFGVEGR
ncbi:MAG: TIGR02452 family protein [Polyangiaceae bacterium]